MTQERMRERLLSAPEPEWVRKMKQHYAKTGTFRAEDLRRLLGDPKRGVEVGSRDSLAKHYLAHE